MTQFESEAPELSAYILDELAGSLARGRRVKIVDRHNIDFIRKELKFLESGTLDDKTALLLGKMSGAEFIATGSLVESGKTYRLRVRVYGVESAINEIDIMLDIAADKQFAALVSAIKSGDEKSDTSYRIEELKRQPETAADFTTRGIMFFERGDSGLALSCFSDAVKLDSRYALGWFWCAAAHFSNGNLKRAISDYTQAIKLEPDNEKTYFRRGFVFAFKGNRSRAIADFTQSIKLNPNNKDAYTERAFMYLFAGDINRAIADFSQIIKIDPNDPRIYLSRARCYKYKGAYDRAIADYTQIIKIDPNDPHIYLSRARCYKYKGAYDHAISDYAQVIKLTPNDAEAYYELGNVYLDKGDKQRAAEYFYIFKKLNIFDSR